MLEGKLVNLKLLEKEDFPLFAEWLNKPEVFGEYNPLHQVTVDEVGRIFSSPLEMRSFIIENKKGKKVGFINHFNVLHPAMRLLEIGFGLVPDERGKGYGSEALSMIVDLLFLTKDVNRIQAQTHARNLASQRILEKVGFKKEGVLRRSIFIGGEWVDSWVYGILREEWGEPKVLTKSSLYHIS
jgi:[ribosomal protein S5]-alanine N-acetyltransferase